MPHRHFPPLPVSWALLQCSVADLHTRLPLGVLGLSSNTESFASLSVGIIDRLSKGELYSSPPQEESSKHCTPELYCQPQMQHFALVLFLFPGTESHYVVLVVFELTDIYLLLLPEHLN